MDEGVDWRAPDDVAEDRRHEARDVAAPLGGVDRAQQAGPDGDLDRVLVPAVARLGFGREGENELFACCVEAPASVRHLIVNAASRHLKTERWDMRVAKEVLGYEPRDQWPEGL